jgi:hypothetical protein
LLQKQVKNILKEIVMGEFNIKIVNYRKWENFFFFLSKKVSQINVKIC